MAFLRLPGGQGEGKGKLSPGPPRYNLKGFFGVREVTLQPSATRDLGFASRSWLTCPVCAFPLRGRRWAPSLGWVVPPVPSTVVLLLGVGAGCAEDKMVDFNTLQSPAFRNPA